MLHDYVCAELQRLKAATAHKLWRLKRVLRSEGASNDFRPTLADRFAEVQPASRRPPDDPNRKSENENSAL